MLVTKFYYRVYGGCAGMQCGRDPILSGYSTSVQCGRDPILSGYSTSVGELVEPRPILPVHRTIQWQVSDSVPGYHQ